MVGTDGRIPNIDNEDFWAHAESSQYHELVDSGHVCHPTFDKHRQENEYERFINSVNTSIQALQKKGVKVNTLFESYIDPLVGREMSLDEFLAR